MRKNQTPSPQSAFPARLPPINSGAGKPRILPRATPERLFQAEKKEPEVMFEDIKVLIKCLAEGNEGMFMLHYENLRKYTGQGNPLGFNLGPETKSFICEAIQKSSASTEKKNELMAAVTTSLENDLMGLCLRLTGAPEQISIHNSIIKDVEETMMTGLIEGQPRCFRKCFTILEKEGIALEGLEVSDAFFKVLEQRHSGYLENAREHLAGKRTLSEFVEALSPELHEEVRVFLRGKGFNLTTQQVFDPLKEARDRQEAEHNAARIQERRRAAAAKEQQPPQPPQRQPSCLAGVINALKRGLNSVSQRLRKVFTPHSRPSWREAVKQGRQQPASQASQNRIA